MAQSIDHDGVIANVDKDGSLSASYLFMCVMASGIATAGLLVNSPAVIIGAMLISPLMAPIIRLGLGVGTLDHIRARQALVVLAIGMAFALFTAMTIVWLSPIREFTPEIAARTRPSLFDLLVAVLSGLAGGYAMVRGRGGAIVGVAIATALMPPMAVVGYGFASGQGFVARGSLLLFTTNLVAIALSVTAITTWFGFSRRRVRHALVWQTGLAFVLVLPLMFPLWQSLRAIAAEARATQMVRTVVASSLGANDSRVMNLKVTCGNDGEVHLVELVLAARHYNVADDARLRGALQEKFAAAELRLSPIIEADPAKASLTDNALAKAAALAMSVPAPAPPAPSAAELAVANFPVPLSGHQIDAEGRRMTLHLAGQDTSLSAAREMEAQLGQRFPDWTLRLVPPVQGLPRIYFGYGKSTLDEDAEAAIGLAEWALRAWDVRSVRVLGYASSDGSGNARLARRRAQAVAERLQEDGFQAEAAVAPAQADQRREERQAGLEAYRIAEILVAPAAQERPAQAP